MDKSAKVHASIEEKAYPWCDIEFILSDEEAELVSEDILGIQANTWYYMDVLFKKRDTTGSLTLKTEAEYADNKNDLGPDDWSCLTLTTEPA